ncbi:HDIG domain-containing metalloprotein [Daejeonella sp. H1SJ63]|uniref:HD family phosphohydrolase n=1 Tax=Daejeonella sp. H1SJ63 TaxID=3034145 RepID=UPI0023EDEEC6|nr:HDIG domain-containing metalloprotein [Daejeonella sp. H1SJ63]
MGLCVFFVTLFLPKQVRFRYEYEKGKTWMQKDLISPYSFAIKKTNEEIEKDKDEILKSILPIYQNDTEIAENSIQGFNIEFDTKWNSSDFLQNEKQIYQKEGNRILRLIFSRGLMNPVKKYQRYGENYNFSLLNNNISTQLNTADAMNLQDAIAFIQNEINSNNSIGNKEWLIKLVSNHLKANYIYDEQLTDKLEENALNSISLTRGMVQKGELIVAKGTMVNSAIFQKLESLRTAYEEDAKIAGNRNLVLLGQVLLAGLIISLLMVFLYLFRRDIFDDNRQLSLILIVITGMLVTLSWAIRIKIPSVYYIPFCIVPIIIRILFDTRLALNIHLLVVLIAGFFVPNSFEFAFLQISAGMVAIYSIKNLIKREQFLISALLILLNYFIAFLGISLIRDGSLTDIEWFNFIPFIFSVLLSLLAYPLIYAFEKMFGITSDVTLMELTNTNSKLLRDLAFKAPGTFQHSLQVANLAEAAIYKIGGNALLVRAGALYHDIGKTVNPHFFIENQNRGNNPHDSISYEQSAQIIIQHVIKGIEIARKHQIPEMIIDFIRTHHGNTRVDYFYQSFLKNFPEKFVDENIFRYPGPIPFSKETAVLMLADSVEAASRSLKEPDAISISDLVERIIDYKLEQDQLTNSNITLKDIETIKLIFKTMLMGIYHVRIDYEID